MEIKISKSKALFLGILLGLGLIWLAYLGNPKNMALCTACFIRDQVGALNMHQSAGTMYFRPEIVGILVGALALGLATGTKARAASAPGLRFLGGIILMVNSLVFLGCTLRMVLRLASGDLSAIVGLVGFVLGVFVGVHFIKKGFTLGQANVAPAQINIWVIPMISVLFLLLSWVTPQLFNWSEAGPGSFHATPIIALIVGLVFGAIAFATRLCFVGSVRDIILIRDFTLITPIIGLFAVMLIYNIMTGDFNIVAFGPIAHNQHLWNVLSMFAVGFAGVLFGGCPVRQVVLAGSGHGNAIMTFMGMVFGAALAHNFSLASAPSVAATAEAAAVSGGPGLNGQIFVIGSIVFLFALAYYVVNKRADIVAEA